MVTRFVRFSMVLMFIFILSMSFSLAVDCWSISTQSSCEENTNCQWKDDPWGSWCEERSCWNQFTQDSCEQSTNSSSSNYINKTCNWRTSSSTGWCSETRCWSYDGNQTACESTSDSLNCQWIDTYDESSYNYPCDGPWEKNCWQQQTESACAAISGCSWGECEEIGCWDQSTKSGCEAATGQNGRACKWDVQYSSCYESGCWDHNNKTGCTSNNCTWSFGYCSTPSCWDYSNTNSSACINNTASLDCSWSGTQCTSNDCWSAGTEGACGDRSGCTWEISDTDGWCEETRCWSYDGTNQTACESNTVGLTCAWDTSTSHCYENVSAFSCSDLTGEKSCFDAFCFWNNTASACQDSSSITIETIHNDWNPGCYIFDHNSTSCNSTLGCYWSNNVCETNTSYLTNSQLNCTVVNESSLCNSIPALSSCCTWQANTCVENKFSNNCYEEVAAPPEGAEFCEDYNAFTDENLCNQIAGSPWYMPCEWNNGTERCGPRLDKIFTEGVENILTIDNKQSCEFAGGKWVTESYCEGSVAIPTGRCEFKFDEERNCDKACYACDYQSDGTNWTTQAKAKSACVGSKLGQCEFTADTSSPNAYGYCNVKDEFKLGIAGDCDSDCGACTHMGDPTSDTADYRPSTYCRNSDAGCKWVPSLDDPTDESEGRCAPLSEKTCEDRCDKCDSETQCVQYGKKKGDSSLSKQCNWDSTSPVKCQPINGADQMEVCWDGIDNNNDGKMDCADSMCFSDPFCGGDVGEGTVCFSADTQEECTLTQTSSGNNCTWVNENWGSWCDIPGSSCWSYDGTNQTFCEAQGCSWHSNFNGFCEEDWDNDDFSQCIGSANSSSCSANANCTWVVDDWCSDKGGWCEGYSGYTGSEFQNCWQYDDEGETACNAKVDSSNNRICQWQNDSWCQSQGASAGWCDHKKFSCWQFHDQSTCTNSTNSDWCQWRSDEWSHDGGWCESKTSGNSCWNQANQSACTAGGCNWVTGFCDPPGFGGGAFGGHDDGGGFAGMGNSCWQYDGNETGCSAQSGCTFFSEERPFCDIAKASNCGQYQSEAGGCNATNGCYWNPQDAGGYCSTIMDQCWSNMTLSSDSAACNANSYCNWTTSNGWNGCQPTCFGTETEASCGAISGCQWVNGWCGSGTMGEFFDEFEGGAPVPLGVDAGGDAALPEIDIVGYGLKDMGDAFGFGIQVRNVENSSMCNGKKLSFGPTAQSGQGKNTTKYYWYLDTDATRSGGCTLVHNSSAAGFEFYATAVFEWSSTANTLSEKYTVSRCNSGNWTVVDIKASGFPQKACTEIHGGMVAIEKNDFERFPTLYTPGVDMRVAVATADANGNITSPTDVADIGFATPGAVDFDLDSLDFFRVGNASTQGKGQDSASKGYVQYSADCWSQAGCSDYACYNHPYCVNNSYGVHASGFEDSRTPKVIGVLRETYPDSALVSYYTDKPANGTLYFYHNDSSCSTLNATVKDTGLTSTKRRNYTLPHAAQVYNDGGVNSLSYDLNASTKYYFKLEVCDDNGKCGISRCSDFVTLSTTDCAFCDFVTKLSAPSGWSVSYDLDRDGTYEHVQGQVCGTNAGMKTNYTSGRNANIKLYKSDNSSYIEFHNTRLSKTGLGSKMTAISDSGALVQGTTTSTSGASIGYAGMIESTRDKIVNNLFPEECYVKIPGSGTCTELWHCDSDLSPCVERTNEATLNETGSDYCIWKIPYCEFSAWAGGEPSTSSSSSSSSSSSGGGSSGGGSSSGGGGGGGGAILEKVEEAIQESPAQEEGVEESGAEQGSEAGADAGAQEGEVEQENQALAGKSFFSKLGDIASNLTWLWISIVVVALIVGAILYIRATRD